MTHQRSALLTSCLFAILIAGGCVDEATPPGDDGPNPVPPGEYAEGLDDISADQPRAPGPQPDPAPCGPHAYNIGAADDPVCICEAGALMCGEHCIAGDEQLIVDDKQRAEATGRCLTAPSCYGQTFRPQQNGWLTQLSFDGASEGRKVLTIYEGEANGCSDIGLVMLHDQELDTDVTGTKVVPLTFPVAVEAGKTYTFKVWGTGYWEHSCSSDDVYASGNFIALRNGDVSFSATIAACP